ncbi:MAG TPA: DUF2750 domain-containing protein [Nannocystaceae bacterium]|nr:DUF2750 domain-containing protein [Nannocystaceae bacterium]
MPHQRITHLRCEPGTDWANVRARLAALAASDGGIAELRLVRIDEQRAVLLASADDRTVLARVDEIVLAPWLAELGLVEPASTLVGETVWTRDRTDAWTHVDELDEVARCEHFVRTAIETGSVWGLYDKTWARSMAAAGREALPLWPLRELAARCIAGPWRTFAARAIDVSAFVEQWLTGMQEDGIVAVVTPTPGDPGVVVEPDVLAQALQLATPR